MYNHTASKVFTLFSLTLFDNNLLILVFLKLEMVDNLYLLPSNFMKEKIQEFLSIKI